MKNTSFQSISLGKTNIVLTFNHTSRKLAVGSASSEARVREDIYGRAKPDRLSRQDPTDLLALVC